VQAPVLGTCLLAVVNNPVIPTGVGYEPAPAAHMRPMLSSCHLSNLGHSVGYKRGPVACRFILPCKDDGGIRPAENVGIGNWHIWKDSCDHF